MSEKEVKELRVFREFAEACGLQIKPDSIERRDPPEPDVRCQIEGEGPAAFELVELVDQNRVARPLNIQWEIMSGFRNQFSEMPETEQIRMKEVLGNATVRVRINPNVSTHQRRAVIPKILRSLLSVQATFQGDYRLPNELTDIACVEIVRGQVKGPRFTAIAGSHYNPAPTDKVLDKFQKRYKTDAPTDLLAYFDTQHSPPRDEISRLVQRISKSVGVSAFRRVWIYDVTKEAILAMISC